jgi:acid phosphatase type 7
MGQRIHKRSFRWVSAVLVAIIGFASIGVQQALAVNSVGNPDAETNLTGWNTSGSGTGVTLTRDTTVAHSGVASFKLTTPSTFSNANAVLNDSPNWVTSSPSTTCTSTAWFKGSVLGMQAKLQLRAYNGTVNVGNQTTSLIMNDTAWHQLTVTMTVAVGNSIDLNPQAYRPGGSQSIWIDDITEDCSGTPANTAPTAALSVTPSSGTAPLAVTADASASTDAENNIATYSFDFGDGSAVVGPQAGATATHTYTTAGTYTAAVTVTDSGSLTGTASQTISVGTANTAPTAALTASPNTGTAPLNVTADASGSTDPQGNIATYSFDFGDGSAVVGPQAGATATHSYTTAGSYTMTVTVLDTGGLSSTATASVTVSAAQSDPVLVAAGDIACTATSSVGSTSCHQQATAALIAGLNPSVIAPLGDSQYGNWCTAAGYTDNLGPNLSYSPNWGTYKSLIRPVPGNHEYNPSDPVTDPTCPSSGYVKGTGYFDYYNGVGVQTGAAGDRSLGYYSYNLGNWHVIVLNSEKDFTTTNSAQKTWLTNDLIAHPTGCQIAMWHRPRWSSGPHGSDGNQLYSQYIWPVLNQYGVDVVLNGHDHDYERFAPQDASGVANANGIREFVLGIGGNSHYTWGTTAANSEVRNNDTFGVFGLTLHSNSYDWQFVHEAGKTFTDSGTTACH